MPSLTVSNVDRSANGVRYIITRSDDTRIKVGVVEITNGVNNVRDSYNEPIRVGSMHYIRMMEAIKHYQAWAEGIKAFAAMAPRALERIEI